MYWFCGISYYFIISISALYLSWISSWSYLWPLVPKITKDLFGRSPNIYVINFKLFLSWWLLSFKDYVMTIPCMVSHLFVDDKARMFSSISSLIASGVNLRVLSPAPIVSIKMYSSFSFGVFGWWIFIALVVDPPLPGFPQTID